MDTSEIYIKMCDYPEIQSDWKPQEGDFFAFCGDPKIIKDYEIWALEKKEMSDIEEWNEIIKTMGGHFVDHFAEARDCFVFLPRQGQIQEMMGKSIIWLFSAFFDFAHDNMVIQEGIGNVPIEPSPFTSMEQLWLAFYMYEKHKKIWNGKEWIDMAKEMKNGEKQE